MREVMRTMRHMVVRQRGYTDITKGVLFTFGDQYLESIIVAQRLLLLLQNYHLQVRRRLYGQQQLLTNEAIQKTIVVQKRGYTDNNCCSQERLYRQQLLFMREAIQTTIVVHKRVYTDNEAFGCSSKRLHGHYKRCLVHFWL